MLDEVLQRLQWLGRDCFLYNGPPVIYFNPPGARATWDISSPWMACGYTTRGYGLHPGDAGSPVDIALLSIAGSHVMHAADAARAGRGPAPPVAIPTHSGDIKGSQADPETFKRLLAGKIR